MFEINRIGFLKKEKLIFILLKLLLLEQIRTNTLSELFFRRLEFHFSHLKLLYIFLKRFFISKKTSLQNDWYIETNYCF